MTGTDALRRFLEAVPMSHVQRLARAKRAEFNWDNPRRCFTGIASGGKATRAYRLTNIDPHTSWAERAHGNAPVLDFDVYCGATHNTHNLTFHVGREVARRVLKTRRAARKAEREAAKKNVAVPTG